MAHTMPVLLLLLLTVALAEGARRVPGTNAETPLEKAIIYLGAHPKLLQDLADKVIPPGPQDNGRHWPQWGLAESRGRGGQDAICTGCKSAISFVKSLIFIGVKWESVRDEAVSLCEVVVAGTYERGEVLCPGIMDNFGPLVYDILKKTKKGSKKICEHMNWCDPAASLKHIHRRSARTHHRPTPDLAAILRSLALKELQKQISTIINETGVKGDERGMSSPVQEAKKKEAAIKKVPEKDTLKEDTERASQGSAKRQEPPEIINIPKINEIVGDLDLGQWDIPGQISDFLDMVRHPESWKKKLPLDKILKESEILEKKLNEVMENVKLKDDLEPNPRKMAEMIADAITRATRSRSKRHLWRSRKREAVKVAHLTDVHIEEDYLTGAATDCGLPSCCQPDTPGEGKAGHWGEFTCNVPPRTTRQLLESAAKQNPDFVIYSGDNPPHTVWKETLETQLNASRWAAEEITKAFYPTKVFPNMGNHENFPTNMYYVPRDETRKLNHEWGQMFKDGAGFTSDQITTIEKAGYYTMLAKPGLRIVAYNSNYGGIGNFYNLLNYDRPEFTEMINWLENTLAAARQASERVIITSHHQYGASENVVAFDEKITRILAKYGDIIVWHPVGHVHRDEFRLNFDPESGDPVGVVMVAMAMNTYPNVNPGYRMFYLDPDTYTVLDYEQFFLDVEKANESPDAPYPIVKLYSAAEDYDMLDLSPSSFLKLYNRMMLDDDLLQKYWHYWRTGTDFDGPCDSACKSFHKCQMISATYEMHRQCMRNQEHRNRPQPVKGLAASAVAQNAGVVQDGLGQSSYLENSSSCNSATACYFTFVIALALSCLRNTDT